MNEWMNVRNKKCLAGLVVGWWLCDYDLNDSIKYFSEFEKPEKEDEEKWSMRVCMSVWVSEWLSVCVCVCSIRVHTRFTTTIHYHGMIRIMQKKLCVCACVYVLFVLKLAWTTF